MARTIDEVLAEIEAIAFSEDSGADKIRALKILKDQQGSTVFLPEPMSAGDAIDRLARLLKAQGRARSRAAWQKAFPPGQGGEQAKLLEDVILSDADRALIDAVHGLQELREYFPEVKRPTGGYPTGYPINRSEIAKLNWCRRKARDLILERKRVEAARLGQDIDERPPVAP